MQKPASYALPNAMGASAVGELTLERLTVEDTPALHLFEKRNRTWFETHVGARADSYWNLDSLTEVVRDQVEAGELMFLLKDQSEIVGRVNLTGVDAGVAQLGYRIGEDHAGQGAATRGVALVIDVARTLGLWALEARVKLVTPASMRVLEKNGFYPTGRAMIATAECKTFRLDLD